MSERVGRGFGGGKVILFGEHAVVYGEPALVAGLPNGAEASATYTDSGDALCVVNEPGGIDVELIGPHEGYEAWWRAFQAGLEHFEAHLASDVAVEVKVDIPIGVGLGSSAALGTAVARSLAELTGESEPIDAAVEACEQVFHGEPSGIDQLAAKHGGVRFFRKDEPEAPSLDVPSFRIGICRASDGASTAEMVSGVQAIKKREPELISHVVTWIGDLSRKASEALRDGDTDRVGELMDLNHGALVSLGVSTRDLDDACHVARDAGAYGAKLTGAGGGGCAVAVVPEEAEPEVEDAWRTEGFDSFFVTLGNDD